MAMSISDACLALPVAYEPNRMTSYPSAPMTDRITWRMNLFASSLRSSAIFSLEPLQRLLDEGREPLGFQEYLFGDVLIVGMDRQVPLLKKVEPWLDGFDQAGLESGAKYLLR